MRSIITLVLVLAAAGMCSADMLLNDGGSSFQFHAVTEIGFAKALSNTIQFGRTGTPFNYVTEGGEDILFPFGRLTAEAQFLKHHEIIFLIQPLDVQTQVALKNDLLVDSVLFPAGTPMDLKYGFDFYRVSYLYDFASQPDREIAVGLSVQLRNASIIFASQDGRLFHSNQDLGIVPALKFRARLPLDRRSWVGTEIDGVYVSGRWISGSKYDFTGALLDGTVRYGRKLNDWLDAFIGIRYLGGGASGSQGHSANDYTNNWLHTATLTLGFDTK